MVHKAPGNIETYSDIWLRATEMSGCYCDGVIRVDVQVSIFPDRIDDRVIGELSCGNELHNAFVPFVDRYLGTDPLNENILQSRQCFRGSCPSEYLQSGCDTWRKFIG